MNESKSMYLFFRVDFHIFCPQNKLPEQSSLVHPGEHKHQLLSLHSPKGELQSLIDPDEHLYPKKKSKELEEAIIKCLLLL